MVALAPSTTCFTVCRLLSLGVQCVAVFLIASSSSYVLHCHVFFYICLMESKLLASVILFHTSFHAIWASTLFANNNTCSLVASSIFSNADICLSISPIMLSSYRPCIHCLVSFSSYSLNSQSSALVYNLPTHSWEDSWLFLFSLQYCSDNTVLLCCVFNF